MRKTIVGFLAAALFAPVAVFAYVDCTDNINGCSSTEAKIAALQAQIAQLTQIIAQLLATRGQTQSTPPYESSHNSPSPFATCFVPIYDLYIGKTDAQTNGDVTRLQNFLLSEGYGDPAGDSGFLLQKATGYYGQMTAASVMRWQKAHGMDFVTLTSGVGKMTRAKMQEVCTSEDRATQSAGAGCSYNGKMYPSGTRKPVCLPEIASGATNTEPIEKSNTLVCPSGSRPLPVFGGGANICTDGTWKFFSGGDE